MTEKTTKGTETKGLDTDVNQFYDKLPQEVKIVYDILQPLLGPNANETIEEYANLLLRAYALDSLQRRDRANTYLVQMGKELFKDYLKNEAQWKEDKIKKYFETVKGGQ